MRLKTNIRYNEKNRLPLIEHAHKNGLFIKFFRNIPLNQTTKANKWQIIQYVVVVFLYWVSMYLYVPTLPVYARSITGDLALVGIVLSMYGLFQGLVRLPLGIISDRLGIRKPLILVGILLPALGALLMGTAQNTLMLMIGRAITGMAAGTWVLLVVGFSGLFPKGENLRAAGLINMVNSVGMLIGALSTGWLNGLGGYSLAFYLAMGVAGLAFLVMLPGKEIPRPPQRPSFSETKTLITHRDVLLPSLLGAVAQYTVWATVFSFIPILARQFGASDVLQSLLQSLNLVVLLIGNIILSVVVKKFKARHLLYFSFVLMAAGLIFAALAQTLVFVLIAQFCNGLGLGIGFPILMGLSVENTSEHERSTAMGLFQSVYAIGMFTGPGISGFLANWLGIQPMFTFTAVIVLLVSIVGVRLLNVKK